MSRALPTASPAEQPSPAQQQPAAPATMADDSEPTDEALLTQHHTAIVIEIRQFGVNMEAVFSNLHRGVSVVVNSSEVSFSTRTATIKVQFDSLMSLHVWQFLTWALSEDVRSSMVSRMGGG
eukprot:SAG31_NODE_22540_length_523_cov_0.971698_1_plen_122_part_00